MRRSFFRSTPYFSTLLVGEKKKRREPTQHVPRRTVLLFIMPNKKKEEKRDFSSDENLRSQALLFIKRSTISCQDTDILYLFFSSHYIRYSVINNQPVHHGDTGIWKVVFPIVVYRLLQTN